MAANQKPGLSLDTNVLLDLASGREAALDFRETFQARNYELVIAPRVVAELRWLELNGTDEERRLARRSVDGLLDWRIRAFDLADISTALAREFGRKLLLRGLLPSEEGNDARILAETSVAAIPALATFDKHLLDVDEDELRLAFDEADLPVVAVVNPARMLRAMR